MRFFIALYYVVQNPVRYSVGGFPEQRITFLASDKSVTHLVIVTHGTERGSVKKTIEIFQALHIHVRVTPSMREQNLEPEQVGF
jgi:hypothetical protein